MKTLFLKAQKFLLRSYIQRIQGNYIVKFVHAIGQI